jgi:hypothetical protein
LPISDRHAISRALKKTSEASWAEIGRTKPVVARDPGNVRRRLVGRTKPHLPARWRQHAGDIGREIRARRAACLSRQLGYARRNLNIDIINTGSELMLGFVLNTHQQWLCRQLADLGYPVTRQTAVADTGSAIQDAVREALARGIDGQAIWRGRHGL